MNLVTRSQLNSGEYSAVGTYTFDLPPQIFDCDFVIIKFRIGSTPWHTTRLIYKQQIAMAEYFIASESIAGITYEVRGQFSGLKNEIKILYISTGCGVYFYGFKYK